MEKVSLEKIENAKIRHHFDKNSGKWFFSIVDVIKIVTQTANAKNYWKALKNRLKKRDNELVMKCNQLKMRANDGKMYLTDAGTKSTILAIIEKISPENLEKFEEFFDKFSHISSPLREDISTSLSQDGEKIENNIPLDVYQKGDYVFVEAFIGGVDLDNLQVELSYEKIYIRGKIIGKPEDYDTKYLKEELIWGDFSKSFSLPVILDINNYEATFSRGYLKIKIKKLDKKKTKEIIVKSI